MRLINKVDLHYFNGMLLEKATGKVIALRELAEEINEIHDLEQLIEFVKTNAKEIEDKAASKKRVEYAIDTKVFPVLTSNLVEPATPVIDAIKMQAEMAANEYLDLEKYEQVNDQLKIYSKIADFLSKDYVLVDGRDESGVATFKTNPLELTADFVVDVVTEYHESKIRQLIGSVTIR